MQPAILDRILFVDDDPNILAALRRNLRKRFKFDTAGGGDEALEMLEKNGPYAVVVSDMSMPIMDGIELLEAVRVNSPETIRIMLTGTADQRSAADAVNRGNVFRFLNKPCPPEILSAALEMALKQHAQVRLGKEQPQQGL